MMFAQACYLLTLYFGDYTRGDEGFTHARRRCALRRSDATVDLANPAVALQSRAGAARARARSSPSRSCARADRPRARRHPRERGAHEDARLRHLPLQALRAGRSPARSARPPAPPMRCSSPMSASTFASIQYSIFPLLWTLLGGAGTVAGPFLGTLLMFYLGRRHRATTPPPICSSSASRWSCSSCSSRAASSARSAKDGCRGCHDAALAREGLSRVSAGCSAVDAVDFDLAAGRDPRHHRAERRRQDAPSSA